MEVEIAEEKINAIEEDEEEVEEVVEEEVEEGFEEVLEDQVEEEEGGGGDGGESVEKGVDNVDSAGDEIKQSDHVSGSSSSSSSGKIFVGGVAWETTEETFTKYFNKYGEITDSVIMKDKHTQKPRGFGFVTFADPSVIDSVLAEGHVIDGRTVEVKRTVPREEAAPTKGGGGRSFKTKKIFVGGIPTSLTEDEFKEHFASYGKVVEHQIMLDHSTGRSRGFGFVTFEDEESVEKVISKGKMQDLGGKQVEIKKAEPKKAGGDSSYNGRGAAAYGGGGGMYGGAGMYGYGGGYGSGAAYYGGGGGYGYGSGGSGYGMGFAPGVDGAMYAGGGGYGYGAPGGYTAGSYGYGGQSRGYGNRYHPYGR